MCGILCEILWSCGCPCSEVASTQVLTRRGPDITRSVRFDSGQFAIRLVGAVLWLQGDRAVSQPQAVSGKDGDAWLLWNGDYYQDSPTTESDTSLVGRLMAETGVLRALSQIKGPYAFVYFSPSTRQLWFGRDMFGRRSLILHTDSSGGVCLSSAAVWNEGGSTSTVEVPAVGVFMADLSAPAFPVPLTFHPWRDWPARDSTVFDGLSAVFEVVRNSEVTVEPPCHPFSSYPAMFSFSDHDALVSEFKALLLNAVRRRVCWLPPVCNTCDSRLVSACFHPKVGILFSGGLDSTVLAALTHRVFREEGICAAVDLLNVAFDSKDAGFDVPDRLTARQALSELEVTCPGQEWNLIEIDTGVEELKDCRRERIRSLLRPHATVLDDSIGCALWFGARGRGRLSRSREPYVSHARVLLTGMGADEQLGGYGRHRSAARDGGEVALQREVLRQLEGIAERNCGRDDRVLSDHARAARIPFLDEDVVDFLMSKCPLPAKMDLTLPRGVGDKLLLRKLAADLGLVQTAATPKRAIQFGTRIAKLEGRKERGSDTCGRLAQGFCAA